MQSSSTVEMLSVRAGRSTIGCEGKAASVHWLQPPPRGIVCRLAIVEQVRRGDASGADPCTENATARMVRQRFEDMKWILEVVETSTEGYAAVKSVEHLELILRLGRNCNRHGERALEPPNV